MGSSGPHCYGPLSFSCVFERRPATVEQKLSTDVDSARNLINITPFRNITDRLTLVRVGSCCPGCLLFKCADKIKRPRSSTSRRNFPPALTVHVILLWRVARNFSLALFLSADIEFFFQLVSVFLLMKGVISSLCRYLKLLIAPWWTSIARYPCRDVYTRLFFLF